MAAPHGADAHGADAHGAATGTDVDLAKRKCEFTQSTCGLC